LVLASMSVKPYSGREKIAKLLLYFIRS